MEDLHKLSEGAQIVVGTPGRVYDLLRRGALCKFLLFLFIYIYKEPTGKEGQSSCYESGDSINFSI